MKLLIVKGFNFFEIFLAYKTADSAQSSLLSPAIALQVHLASVFFVTMLFLTQ
jgi:hypothetical protein